ncbi:unnamed protein product [Calypogeia fissa]
MLRGCTGLKSLPNSDSLGRNISPPGDNGLRLYVDDCPFLDGLVMQQLGWIESGMEGLEEFRRLRRGKWYKKKWVGENIHSAEPA